MTQRTAFFPLSGGLDLVSPAIVAQSGSARLALNYEAVPAGYRRMAGYERFDGKASPTDTYTLTLSGGGTEESAATARETARAAIEAVPGSGPVRGVWLFNEQLYAWRDNVGATACIMHRATPTGWVAMGTSPQLSFINGGTYEILEGDTITGQTSGATAVVERVVVTNGSWASNNVVGYLVLSGQTGTFQAEEIKVGTNLGAATITGDSAAPSFPPGGRYEFVTHNFYGASNLKRMYGVNGVGKAFEFDGTTVTFITTGMVIDTPNHLAVHRQHLFLSFPGGSLQHSAIGNPVSWVVVLGAGELAIGDEITDLLSATAANLAIFGRNSVNVLYGNDSTDWELQTLTDEAGAIEWTADKVGQAIYMDNRGVRNLSATQAYGNFQIGTMTRKISPLVARKWASGAAATAAVRIRSRDTYRVFFDDGTALSVYAGRKDAEVMPLSLGKVVRCIVSAENSANEEVLYFGSDDGFVYQMDKGRSFDSEAVTYYLRLPFNHLGSPQVMKVFKKAVIECEAGPQTSLRFSGEVDYGNADEPSFESVDVLVQGGGGFWNDVNWDEFYWSSPAEGTAVAYLDAAGRNMSLLIGGEEADEDPHVLQGLTLFYIMRGLQR